MQPLVNYHRMRSERLKRPFTCVFHNTLKFSTTGTERSYLRHPTVITKNFPGSPHDMRDKLIEYILSIIQPDHKDHPLTETKKPQESPFDSSKENAVKLHCTFVEGSKKL
jgi:hypothetical protein